jgi:hypothetical protein
MLKRDSIVMFSDGVSDQFDQLWQGASSDIKRIQELANAERSSDIAASDRARWIVEVATRGWATTGKWMTCLLMAVKL